MNTIETTLGNIVIELYEEDAPISCANFRQYVADDFYTGTIFHRIIPNFMIQCGGMTEDMSSKETREEIKNEAANGKTNVRGTLAMARTAAIDSASSQFFINLSDNDFLNHGGRDYGYAVFGEVSEGMDVIESISAVDTGTQAGHQDVPLNPIKILSVHSHS